MCIVAVYRQLVFTVLCQREDGGVKQRERYRENIVMNCVEEETRRYLF
jgi:hypothetical protein